IQTVYKISEQEKVEPEELRRKVLASRPELAQLADHVSAEAKDFQSRNKLADGYIQEGLLWTAYHLYQQSLSLSEGNFDAEIGLAQIWDKWGDYAAARQHATAALANNLASAEQYAHAYEVLGRIHLHRNAPLEAVDAFKMAADLTPEKP